ncbi:uncharacterized protein LOC141900634 [Tubulanus polymorphus]|uniref:uncharacterized protein LOC141900634 n=1 Tax=Tubulanus polymorphus TaxID=672921 RepID=UPI003DA4B598
MRPTSIHLKMYVPAHRDRLTTSMPQSTRKRTRTVDEIVDEIAIDEDDDYHRVVMTIDFQMVKMTIEMLLAPKQKRKILKVIVSLLKVKGKKQTQPQTQTTKSQGQVKAGLLLPKNSQP